MNNVILLYLVTERSTVTAIPAVTRLAQLSVRPRDPEGSLSGSGQKSTSYRMV